VGDLEKQPYLPKEYKMQLKEKPNITLSKKTTKIKICQFQSFYRALLYSWVFHTVLFTSWHISIGNSWGSRVWFCDPPSIPAKKLR
jgi:hypothetical protein